MHTFLYEPLRRTTQIGGTTPFPLIMAVTDNLFGAETVSDVHPLIDGVISCAVSPASALLFMVARLYCCSMPMLCNCCGRLFFWRVQLMRFNSVFRIPCVSAKARWCSRLLAFMAEIGICLCVVDGPAAMLIMPKMYADVDAKTSLCSTYGGIRRVRKPVVCAARMPWASIR